jgi:drug/metabolite transporter (DMT)-like permease
VASNPSAKWVPRYLATGLAWGCSFLFIKQSLTFLTPVGVAFSRWLLGALTLLAISRVRGVRLPSRGPVWIHLAVVALIFNVGPGVLFAFAETRATSILAGLVNSLTPLTSLFFISLVFRDEPVTRVQVLGMGVGLVGVVVLLGVWRGVGANSWEAVAALSLAVSLYGVTFPYIRRHLTPRGLAPSSLASAQMLLATIFLAPAFAVDGFNGHSPTAASLVSLLLLGAIGSGFAYMWNFEVIAAAGGATASTVTYLTPVVAILAGVTILHEPLLWFEPVGGAIVLVGAAIGQDRLRRHRPIGLRLSDPPR